MLPAHALDLQWCTTHMCTCTLRLMHGNLPLASVLVLYYSKLNVVTYPSSGLHAADKHLMHGLGQA